MYKFKYTYYNLGRKAFTDKGSNIYCINLKEIGEKYPGNVFKFFSKIEDYKSINPIEGIRNQDLLNFN